VTYVLGEFYWKVAVGESVDTADYIAPPYGISKEVTTGGAREINYSHARYMTPREVQQAFGLEQKLPKPRMIGPMQPFPGPNLFGPFAILLALLILAAMVISIAKPRRTLFDRTYDLTALPAEEGEPNERTIFTDPFEVSGRDNVRVEAYANVDNEWLYVQGELVNMLTNSLVSFYMPIEYYHGVDQGERWSEGRRYRRQYVSRPEKGSYVLRVSASWEQGKEPRNLRLTVIEGIFRWPHFIVSLIVISIPAALALFRLIRWETERWKESAHSPYGALSGDDDDEE
jgi:hypothetical protein